MLDREMASQSTQLQDIAKAGWVIDLKEGVIPILISIQAGRSQSGIMLLMETISELNIHILGMLLTIWG